MNLLIFFFKKFWASHHLHLASKTPWRLNAPWASNNYGIMIYLLKATITTRQLILFMKVLFNQRLSNLCFTTTVGPKKKYEPVHCCGVPNLAHHLIVVSSTTSTAWSCFSTLWCNLSINLVKSFFLVLSSFVIGLFVHWLITYCDILGFNCLSISNFHLHFLQAKPW